MDQHQQALRRAAAQEFLNSLEQLHHSLTAQRETDAPADSVLPPPAPPEQKPERRSSANLPSRSANQKLMAPLDLSALEEAAADIEHFMQRTHPPSPPESFDASL